MMNGDLDMDGVVFAQLPESTNRPLRVCIVGQPGSTAFDPLFFSKIRPASAPAMPVQACAVIYSSEPIVGRDSERVVYLNVEPWSDVRAEVTGSNVDAPFRVGQTRDPYCVNEVGRQRRSRDVLDPSGFLVDFESRGDKDAVFDGNWESDPTKRASFPIQGIPTIAVLLSVGPPDTRTSHKTEFFPDHEEFCPNEIDVTVGRIFVLDGLYDEGIIRSEHSAYGNGRQIFVAVIVRRQDLGLEVKDIHSAEVEKRTDRRISPVRVVAAGVPEFQPVPKSLFDSNVDVVSGDGAGVDGVEADRWPAELVLRRRNDIGQRLQKDSGLAVHGQRLRIRPRHEN
jgi:hypothetical protein